MLIALRHARPDTRPHVGVAVHGGGGGERDGEGTLLKERCSTCGTPGRKDISYVSSTTAYLHKNINLHNIPFRTRRFRYPFFPPRREYSTTVVLTPEPRKRVRGHRTDRDPKALYPHKQFDTCWNGSRGFRNRFVRSPRFTKNASFEVGRTNIEPTDRSRIMFNAMEFSSNAF